MALQTTLSSATEPVRGVGLHTGAEATVIVEPAPVGTGVRFVRTDLPGSPEISLEGAGAEKGLRRTAIGEGGASVQTVEHLLSALAGIGIDNARVSIDGPEVPGMDGSAAAFVEALQKVGRVEQEQEREPIAIEKPILVADGAAWILALPHAGGGLEASYQLDYDDHPFLGRQRVAWSISSDLYAREIAGARTFVLLEEAQMLRAMGLGQGASTQNTLVVGPEGVVENELRWADEFARHKLLDLIGDLAVLGRPLEARIHAHRSGHALNALLAAAIRGEGTAGAEPGTVDDVEPHVTEFRLAPDDPVFARYFPEDPIYPELYALRAFSVAGGGFWQERDDSSPRLIGLSRVRVDRHPAVGDELRLESRPVGGDRVSVVLFAGGDRIAEAILNYRSRS